LTDVSQTAACRQRRGISNNGPDLSCEKDDSQMENRDELYDGLLETTLEMLDSVGNLDIDRLGKAIDSRQQFIDRLAVLKADKPTDGQKEKLNEIIILDKKAGTAVRKLFEKYKNDIKNSRVKYGGMIKYNNSRYDLSSGRMIDKKK
jgi:hypothetical protein